jgi:fido (protein-threonine AMPylation protein)
VGSAFLHTNFANGKQTIKPFSHPTKLAEIGKVAQIIAMTASHHRLANIHPFPEGNLNR